MECEKCGDKGFTEQEHGLVNIFCDCEKGKEKRVEITGQQEGGIVSDPELGIVSRIEPDNQPAGSPDTSKPKQPKKPRKKKKARKRAG